ncbi:MAG: hypothetical protein J6S85_21985 [Methanobrevibacter sp.]|nr:hypothetical protein [Methanobrevibacter sp.]
MRSLYGSFRTRKFCEIYPDANTFLNEWKGSGVYASGLVTDANIKTLYYLLYAKYGNSNIASSDENQFKYKVWGIIFQSGPSWEKRLSIQSTLRGLTESDLLLGAKAIYNHAYNPSTTPSTGSDTELDYINEQNTTNYKKSKLEAYQILWELIKFDVTEEFLDRFKKLFLVIVMPEEPLLYVEEDE